MKRVPGGLADDRTALHTPKTQATSCGKLLLFGALVGLTFGTQFVATSTAVLNIYAKLAVVQFELNAFVVGCLSVAVVIGLTCGALLTPLVSRCLSKKAIFFFACLTHVVCGIALCFPVHWVLIFALRIMEGFAQGFISTLTPLWINEVADAKQRKMLMPFVQLFVNGGILLSNVFLIPVQQRERFFWLPFVIPCVTALGLLAISLMLPEEQKRLEEQHEGLTEIKVPMQTLTGKQKQKSILNIIFLSVGSQACGINVVIMYATALFKNVFQSELSAAYGAILISIANTAGTVIPLPLTSKVGRKTLLLTGWAILTVAQVILIISYSALKEHNSTIVIIGSMLFLVGFQIGPGPMVGTLLGEIFPRSQAQKYNGIGWTLIWFTNIVIILTFPFFGKVVWIAYFIYCCISTVCGIGLIFTLPETFGKTQDQIEMEVTTPCVLCARSQSTKKQQHDINLVAMIPTGNALSLLSDPGDNTEMLQ